MADLMTFPNTVEEFMDRYKITDTEQIYTNGVGLVPIFRMRQWFAHADMVEVVRCKDCVHYWKNWKDGEPDCGDDVAVCLASPKDDAFCSEGERREDE